MYIHADIYSFPVYTDHNQPILGIYVQYVLTSEKVI